MTNLDALWGRWVAAADLDALGQLFDETAPGLRRLALFMASDVAAAEDALQNTYLAALERPKSLGDDGRVEAWLSGILVRQVRRQRRGAARGGRPVTDEAVLSGMPSEERSPAGQVAGVEFEDRVGALIDGLPASYAEPLRRKLLGGESARAIAAELGLEPSTVHTRVSRGLAKLREALPAGLAAPALAQSSSEGLGGSGNSAAESLSAMRARFLAGAKNGLAVSATSGGAATWGAATFALWVALGLALVGAWWIVSGAQDEAPETGLEVVLPGEALGWTAEAAEVLVAVDAEPTKGRELSVATAAPDAAAVTRKHWSGTVVPRVAGVRVHRLEEGTLRPLELLATTEEGGRFAFTGPAELERQIGFFAEGHAVWASPLGEGQRQRSDRDSSRRVRGDRIEFGDPRLSPGATVSGRVVDSNGNPLAGATLYVTPRRMMAAEQHDRPFGETGAGGRFELLTRVPYEESGQVLFAVVPDGRVGWVPFACVEGRDRIVDLEVVVPDTVTGRVRVVDEATENPIAGARVVLCPAVEPPFNHSQSGRAYQLESREEYFFLGAALDDAWSTVSGEDGWAELTRIPATPGQGIQVDGVAPVACWVTASAPGYELAESKVLHLWAPSALATMGPEWSAVFPGEIILPMRRVAPPTPSVSAAAATSNSVGEALPLSIRVVDEHGEGLDGFRVGAVQGDRGLGRGGLWNGGRWKWSDANAGEWVVKVYDPLVMRDWRRPPVHTVTLKGGEEEQLIRIQRPAPDPAGNVTLKLRAKESLEPLDPTDWTAFRRQPDDRFQSEVVADIRAQVGALRLENLPPGNWWVKVRARGFAESEIRFEIADGEDRELFVDLEPVPKQ